MKTVSDILRDKGRKVWSISPDTTVIEALKLMAEHNIGALVVAGADTPISGIFSERDYARKVILKGKSSEKIAVGEIMSDKVLYVSPANTLDECMALMTSHHFRHLPVLDGEKLAGIISIGDVVKSIISGQEFEIQQLETYIQGLLHGR